MKLMAKRLHIYPADDLRRSVLEGVTVTANCGLRKQATAEDIDKAVTSNRQACKKCLAVVAERTKKDDVVLVKREGWAALRDRVKPNSYKFTINGSVMTFRHTDDWPIAG